jgi:tetrahydromethanopterin S-methyltransferase subunit C
MNDGRTEHEGIGAAVKQLSQDIGILIRSEMELARNEMMEKAKTAGVGAGMLSGSAITGVLTLGSLTALLILAISLALPAWLAALIVTVMWAAVTAILALAGKNKIQNAGPLVPEQTIESVKEDVQWAQSGLKSGKK